MIDYKKFIENSRKWLANYIKANHLQSCVLGISGGIDSTISVCLAKPVCDALNIPLIGRSLPTGTNKQSECDVADLVGNAFCTDYKVVALDRTYFEMEEKFIGEEGPISNLQKGNIKARLRMIYLYNLASIHRGVVLDNDNFTEWNLGFFTRNGDVGDINLGLHYLWKTEVYELAKYLTNNYAAQDRLKESNAIIESIKLTPTDGNGVSNSDCDQFGLDDYEQVDDVLKTMYYRNQTEPDFKGFQEYNPLRDLEYDRLIDSYNEQGVDKVMLLHQNTAYKRKGLPIKPTRKELGL